jgi:hypothetical protein
VLVYYNRVREPRTACNSPAICGLHRPVSSALYASYGNDEAGPELWAQPHLDTIKTRPRIERLRWSRPRLVHVRFNSDSDRQPSKCDPALRANRRHCRSR